MADLELIFHRKHKGSHCSKEHQMLSIVDMTLALRAMAKTSGNEKTSDLHVLEPSSLMIMSSGN